MHELVVLSYWREKLIYLYNIYIFKYLYILYFKLITIITIFGLYYTLLYSDYTLMPNFSFSLCLVTLEI